MGDLFNVIADFFLIFDKSRFDRKKKERRQYEKENNLPKKVMIYPLWILFGILILLLLTLRTTNGYFNYSKKGINRTKKKMVQIQKILEEEKESTGKYPEYLIEIERNNPLRKNIILDY